MLVLECVCRSLGSVLKSVVVLPDSINALTRLVCPVLQGALSRVAGWLVVAAKVTPQSAGKRRTTSAY